MDSISYQNYEETRTAGRFANGTKSNSLKSVQSWKSNKQNPENIRPSPAQANIIASLNNSIESRTASFTTSLKHANTYAPQNNTSLTNGTHEAFTFGDVIDVVNPLQHIPLVNVAYREWTGDELHPVSGIIGGALYGGPVGAVTGTINAVSKIQTGKDMGEHALILLKISGDGESNLANITRDNRNKDLNNKTNEAEPDLATKNKSFRTPTFDDVTKIQLAAMPPKAIF